MTKISALRTTLKTRLIELEAKVQAEEENLPAFRVQEAFQLALTDEEQADLSFLARIRGELNGGK